MKFLSKETISGFSKNKAKNGKKQSNQKKKIGHQGLYNSKA